MNRSTSTAAIALLLGIGVCLLPHSAAAAELKKETAAAYDRYLIAAEDRTRSQLQSGSFLFIDQWPEERRKEAYAQLRRGTVLVEQATALEEGHPIEVAHGLIHDWIGVLFIPNATLPQALAVMQDYDNYQSYFKPDIRRSRLLSRDGDTFKVSMQMYKKSLVTVAINADFDIRYERPGPNRVTVRSSATRLAEVKSAGQPGEHEQPPADANGYLWRLCDYWQFEEKDGGVYVQLESIGLSRSVPAIVAWLVNPLLKSIPRGALSSLLKATRSAVTVKAAPAP